MKRQLHFTITLCAACACIAGCAAHVKKSGGTQSALPQLSTTADTTMKKHAEPATPERKDGLSPASQLIIKACDNYLSINPDNQKSTDVLSIKASIYYNNKLFDEARASYKSVLDRFPKDAHCVESLRMIAQSYYEEKKFDEAQAWYRKLKERAVDGSDKQEAVSRIAESIFKQAEAFEADNKLKNAAAEYERVSLEFPDAKIADVALLNAGLACEKMTEWTQAILMYQKLVQKYIASKLLPKAYFRTAKCYEKLTQWNNAGETYLRVVANFPASDLAPLSIYNAGFAFENAGKLPVAAATFEKMVQLYPQSDDAADVLFRAGEIYGKLKDWAGVTRVNQEFMRKFGNDADRAIQALCMSGVALYMQNRQTEATEQLTKAIVAYAKLPKPSSTNKYYAAKAEFTIGEILLEAMNAVALTLPKETYKKQLKAKSELLDKAVTQYSRVVKYQISEWTTRGIFSIAKAYEDFGVGIFKQQRPDNTTIDERLALELGIAQAVEEYFVNKAAHYHEENVKLAIKEKIEDKYVLDSRQKLTSLPYMAGSNYLSLVDIAQNATSTQKLDGFALIAKKLELLQKIGPFQERAIVLFLKSLENGSRYQQIDESYTKASSFITKTAFTVGKTYADIASTARSAPVPTSFDPYESFVYKTKLLKQIEAYEDKSQEYFLRTVKIAEAYKIEDEFVKQTRDALPKLLFVRGRCYDVLCVNVFRDPPFPAGASAAEKDEYRARFEEIGLQFQETAFDLYKSILSYAQQQYATGDYVTHAYVRMFQKSPKDYGVKTEKLDKRVITSGSDWKCSTDTAAGWTSLDFKDTAWKPAGKGTLAPGVKISGFPDSLPRPMWSQISDVKTTPVYMLALRRTFYNTDVLKEAHLWISAIDECHVFLNEKQLVPIAPDTLDWAHAQDWDLLGKLRDGKNVLAVFVRNNIRLGFGCMPYLTYTVAANSYVPQPPGASAPLDAVKVTEGAWEFPAIDNFTLTKQNAVKNNKD